MCGIAGYFGNKPLSASVVEKTLSSMNNRGPDSKGYKKFLKNKDNISLFHSRLSIIDLEDRSNQPYKFKNYHIVFNGEIYNYIEIRNDLISKGYVFETTSDTEVLIKSFDFYGKDCLEKFEGMWAFVIYDECTNELFISRDRFGEKPLYYLFDKSNFIFGSEIKFIKNISQKDLSINKEYLRKFLVLGHKSLYKDNDCSFYNDIAEINPGELAVFKNGRLFKEAYWKPEINIDLTQSREYWIEKTKEHTIKSVELRMRSDVPLSFCLSGGIDSGTLVSIASKVLGADVHTFSIVDSDKRYNEEAQIDAIVNDTNCKNLKVRLEKSDYFDSMYTLSEYRNGPIATCSYFVHSLLVNEISKKGFKIGMSGVGADEIFTGYFDHFSFFLKHIKDRELFNSSLRSWEKHVRPMIRNPLIVNLNNFYSGGYRDHIYLNSDKFNKYFHTAHDTAFNEKQYTESSELRNRMLNELFHEVVRVILHQDDMNSMFHSIENRSPFLDRSLFEMSMKIPTEHLIKNGYNKSILRDSMKGILHDDVRLFREKRGFNASITSFLNMNSKKFKDFMSRDSLIYEIIKKDDFLTLLSQDRYPNSYNKFIFRAISSKMFLENNNF
jgi:asparagine synthase (glutamine-hydrolysing)